MQVRPEPIGATVDAIRRVLSWLGPCRRKAAAHSIHLIFAFAPETNPTTTLKLKVEINTREHESLYGLRAYPFEIENPWFAGSASIASFEPEELFGTKLRALLQRRKGRDLFDLNEGFEAAAAGPGESHRLLRPLPTHEGTQITRANAEERMLAKLTRSLTDDIAPLLSTDVVYRDAEAQEAFERVWFRLIAVLSGEAWHRSEAVIEELRATAFPNLLRNGSA